jgi:hypothetical protein
MYRSIFGWRSILWLILVPLLLSAAAALVLNVIGVGV